MGPELVKPIDNWNNIGNEETWQKRKGKKKRNTKKWVEKYKGVQISLPKKIVCLFHLI